MGVIQAKGINPIKEALKSENESVRAAAAWSLGQMGAPTPDHAKALAEQDIPRLLLDLYRDPSSS
jgi:HEAT repeat protein